MPAIAGTLPEKLQECFGLLVDSVVALQRENKEMLWGSMVKETMKRKKPSFNESYYGFRTFRHLLEDAQRRGIVMLRRDQKSGSYVVEDLGPAARAEAATGATAESAAGERKPEAASVLLRRQRRRGATPTAGAPGRRRRGRGGRGRRSGVPVPAGAPSEASAGAADDGDDDDDSDDMAADSHPSLPAVEAQAGAAPAERPAFSLFSWLRKDSEEKKP